MTRASLYALAALFGVAPMLPAQDTPEITVRVWQTGDPVPLPVQVVFFSSQPNNTLDSAAIHQAARAALTAARLPHVSAVVSGFPLPKPDQLHLQLEVNHYGAGELRIRSTPVAADGRALVACSREQQSFAGNERLSVTLYLSHRIRDTLECIKQNYSVRWP